MIRLAGAMSVVALLVAGCGGVTANAHVETAPPPSPPVLASPDVELVDADSAVVKGQRVAFDGVREGLAWPALAKAVGRHEGDATPVTIAVRREVPMANVVRAVWTLRGGDVRLQTADAKGAVRVLELRAKPAQRQTGCHLAVFVQADGSLRIAAPGGARAIAQSATGEAPNDQLARALDVERMRCPIRYVAFGAQSPDAAWGSVFDVASAVDAARSAGDARYVLGESVHLEAKR